MFQRRAGCNTCFDADASTSRGGGGDIAFGELKLPSPLPTQTWPTWTSRNQHVDAKFLQIPDFECESYDRYFNRRKAVEQHMDAIGHWADSTSDEPGQYCDFDACSEVFDDEELRDHDIKKHFYS
ncbi:hypothetical protein CTA1_9428 [Colletotrichum tanaceti]|uniref:C2H2-type domain-containing protein n=1 Tax=Colletotrichum tanaceti TaxID=1306861 RepID=A0A4U6XH36_9PEZI|nr:hypothetical protein CTA1_9428 [Colletotrichum tanaceti]